MPNNGHCLMGHSKPVDHGQSCEDWYNCTDESTLSIAMRDGARCNNCVYQNLTPTDNPPGDEPAGARGEAAAREEMPPPRADVR